MNLSSKWICCNFFALFLVLGCSATEPIIVIKEQGEEILVPVYYREHILEKENYINEAIKTAQDDYASLVFFTDAHWGDNYQNSPLLINHIIRNTSIIDVVFGGDVITTSFTKPYDSYELGLSFQAAFDTLNCNMYFLYGNHDNNSDEHPAEVERHLTDEQVFDYLQKGMSKCEYGGFFNFYFDRASSKTRFICLDTGRFYYSILRGKTIDTVRFLLKVLSGTPDGWNVVILSHLWYNLNYSVPRTPYMPDHIKSIVKILDDYNARVKGVFSFNGEAEEYDFSGTSSKIRCCIGGHCHIDSVQFSDGGIPIIITTTDSKQTVNGEEAIGGTLTEQAISVFVIDYTNQILKMIRIGRGKDFEIQLSSNVS